MPSDTNLPPAADKTSFSATNARLDTDVRQPMVLPVIEEQALISREVVESGRLRIRKTVQQVEQPVQATLQHDEVQVEHVPVNQFVADDAPLPGSRQEGDVLIVPVLREVVVTRVLLVEELRISKRVVEEEFTSTVQLRQEQIQIERDALTPDSSPNTP
ncbi:YsnF/AvaK domain-containing protein [Hymenobacter sp. ISL-91]|uniref:YsnF/AvaK domain-containing protein n=1 Tax=Hymenobacter sp. ISL-91 TaxID=2819151 RepID=UPI001BE7AC17|nr:YsnF/AvaK domain-containing protein [Hymenobacter sp. ISL-91]MBT2558042.1 YsnF/AvaK domain-containing protein [Hymenobacter sp. ISL-91]